jgi:8-oxo-dGTP diphosphatase
MKIDKVLILASAIIKNKSGEVLLLKRGETKTFQSHWQLPEGKLEEKESPQEALKREVKEELGLDVNSAKLSGVNQSMLEAKGITYLVIRIIFLVKIQNKKIILSGEHSDYAWVKLSKIPKIKFLPGTLESIKNIQ